MKGVVSKEGNVLSAGAEIIVWNPDGTKRSKNVLTSDLGEYWRILVPGPDNFNTFVIQVNINTLLVSVCRTPARQGWRSARKEGLDRFLNPQRVELSSPTKIL